MSEAQSFQHNFTIYYVKITSNRFCIGWMQSWNNRIICSVQININLQWDLFYLNYWISLLLHRERNNFRHERKIKPWRTINIDCIHSNDNVVLLKMWLFPRPWQYGMSNNQSINLTFRQFGVIVPLPEDHLYFLPFYVQFQLSIIYWKLSISQISM